MMPFEELAAVVLPDHLHCLWQLPQGDSDYSKRWGLIKTTFTKSWRVHAGPSCPVSASRKKHREKNIWQRRFWEHTIRDNVDFARHLDYIHFNPVKHGLVACAHAWPHSTIHKWIASGVYREDWCCTCRGRPVSEPDFSAMEAECLE